jgi:hypothetical protein
MPIDTMLHWLLGESASFCVAGLQEHASAAWCSAVFGVKGIIRMTHAAVLLTLAAPVHDDAEF